MQRQQSSSRPSQDIPSHSSASVSRPVAVPLAPSSRPHRRRLASDSMTHPPMFIGAVSPPAPSRSPNQTNHHHNQHYHQHHHRRKSVTWVPDSLAEKCYGCQTTFTLVLRRHHCRRCGNVFCDACSSSRIPLVTSGFFTPVRVCDKCCVAARKAHAKMVEAAQQQQHRSHSLSPSSNRNPLIPRQEQYAKQQPDQTRKLSHAMTDSFAAMYTFQQPMSRPHRYDGESSRDAIENNRKPFDMMYAGHLFDDHDRSSEDWDCFLQTLPGEMVHVRSENVRIRFMDRVEHLGTLYVTNYRLIFSPYVSADSYTGNRFSTDLSIDTRKNVREDELPYTSDFRTDAVNAYQAINIVSIERAKRKEMVETDSGMIDLVCKDFRHVQFFFDKLVANQTYSHFDRTFSFIRQHALGEPTGRVEEFARYSLEKFKNVSDGWKVYDPLAEFQRMGVSSSSRWRISRCNDKYELCLTYPSLLAVPGNVSDNVLGVAAKFRSKGRIPVLSWRDVHTGAVICRSSQPLVGLGQKQCESDIFLIQAIAAANPSSSRLVIIDARPWKNAVAQKAVGRAGYELTAHYETRHTTASLKFADMVASEQSALAASKATTSDSTEGSTESEGISLPPGSGINDYGFTAQDRQQLLEAIESPQILTECKLIFMGIENIHTMRKSYNKLMDLCISKQNNDKWLDQLASTHWMDHISRILDSAVEIARIIKVQKSSVLIHCSDGWDRTTQLTALTELMIDPYYRTIRGFQALIEKEWCSFGHKFRERTGHGLSNASSEISPIFLQWIDCVWQLLIQFPCSFEFNERYLIMILDHLYSCRFGTFLYDSEKERVEQERKHPTNSLWSYLSTLDRSVILNAFYHPHEAPRKKWKASVTATRQCFEIPSRIAERNGYATMGTQKKSYDDEAKRFSKTRAVFIGSDSSSPLSNSYSSDSESNMASSPSSSRDELTESDFDEFLVAVQSELAAENGRERAQTAEVNGTRSRISEDGDDQGLSDNRSSCYHKIVRDLDSGFSFPQPLEASALANFSSSPPGQAPARPFSSQFPPRMDSNMSLLSTTPSTRPSLSDVFAPIEQPPRSTGSAYSDSVSESDENSRIETTESSSDIIIPCSAVKALQFWSRYYLRWDPTGNFGCDASVELEIIHRDLLQQLQLLRDKVSTIQQQEGAKWQRKLRNAQAKMNFRKSISSSSDLRPEPDITDETEQSQISFFRPSGIDVVQLSPDRNTKRPSDGSADTGSIEQQIEELKRQRLRRLEAVEAAYQEDVLRLMNKI